MRRKRSVFYHIEVQGFWWFYDDREFGKYHDYSGSASSSRFVCHIRKAHRIAIASLRKFNRPVHVTKYFYRNGKRYCKEWVYDPTPDRS